jgi:hypothetical protein
MGKGQSRQAQPVNSVKPAIIGWGGWRPIPPMPPIPPYSQTPPYFGGITNTGNDVSDINKINNRAAEYVSQVNSVQSTVQTNDGQIKQLYSDAKSDRVSLSPYTDAYEYVEQYIDSLKGKVDDSSKLLSDINRVQYTVQNTDYGQIQSALNDANQRSIDAAGSRNTGESNAATSIADSDDATAKTLLNDIVNKINQISGFEGQSNQLLSDAKVAAAQVKSIASTPATYSDGETLTKCYDKYSRCTLGTSTIDGEKYVKEFNSNWPSSGNKYNNVAKACDYSCPCVYGTTFIPDDTCSRTCGEPGLLTGHYALVSGPTDTCSAKCGTPGFIGDCKDPAKQTTRIPCNNNPVMPCPPVSTLGGLYPGNIMESFTGNVDLTPFTGNVDLRKPLFYNERKPVSDNVDAILDYSEANLLQALYQFNNEYYYYVNQCNNKPGSTVPTGSNNPVNPATNLPLNCDDMLYQIKEDGKVLNAYVGSVANIPNPADMVKNSKAIQTNDQYNTIYGNVISNYGTLVQERSDLDSKLKELYDLPGSSISLDYRYNYEATIYSGILLTVLASGLIFYTFTKLDS